MEGRDDSVRFSLSWGVACREETGVRAGTRGVMHGPGEASRSEQGGDSEEASSLPTRAVWPWAAYSALWICKMPLS